MYATKVMRNLQKIYTDTIINWSPKYLENLNELKLSERSDVKFLKKNFFLIKKKIIKKSIINLLSKEIYSKFIPENIYKPKDLSSFKTTKTFSNLSYSEIVNFPKISNDDFLSGIEVWRSKCSYVAMKNALLVCPNILLILQEKKILNIIKKYFDGMVPGISYVKVMQSFNNGLPSVDTQFFHNDLDSRNLLKLFIPLDSIDLSNGPTQIIKNTNIFQLKKQELNKLKLRMNYDELPKKYLNNLINLVSKKGDAYFVNTSMLHRGSKPVKRDRTVIIMSFSLHKEVNSTGEMFINSSTLKKFKNISSYLRFFKVYN